MSTYKKNKFEIPERYKECSKKIWDEIAKLVGQYTPLDLGLGFPDYPPPKHITETLLKIATEDNSLIHQYTRDFGHLRFVNAFAKLYSKLLNKDIDPKNEVLTMASGCQVLYATIMGLIDQDDEVIIIEPYFDFYETLVNIAGGKCRFIPLRGKKENSLASSDWSFDTDELQSVFNEKTKLFILNTPSNPLGKVYNIQELTIIADLCRKWNVVCMADEVYEFYVYNPNKHIRMCSLPGMWERTITISCPGKTFGVTGWELGVAYGPENLLFNLQMVHQNLVYTSATPIQEAYGILLEKEIEKLDQYDSILATLPKELEIKRDFMVKTLLNAGMKPVIPEGGFMILADWTPISLRIDLNTQKNERKDFKFVKWMIENLGVAAIPTSAFFSEANKHLGENYVRFCFLKKEETLKNFANILKKFTDNL